MKKVKKVDDSAMAAACVDKIKARLERDAHRLKNKREVYTYRLNGLYSDNLLLFESATKEVHAEVFKSWFNGFSAEEKARFKLVEVVHVGTYDTMTMQLNTAKEHKVLFKGV